MVLVVGDFNARVGSRERSSRNEMWSGARGPHGLGKMNEAGTELLSFCALNELVIMTTEFNKKRKQADLATSPK